MPLLIYPQATGFAKPAENPGLTRFPERRSTLERSPSPHRNRDRSVRSDRLRLAQPGFTATGTSLDTSRCATRGSRQRQFVAPFLPPDFLQLTTSEFARHSPLDARAQRHPVLDRRSSAVLVGGLLAHGVEVYLEPRIAPARQDQVPPKPAVPRIGSHLEHRFLDAVRSHPGWSNVPSLTDTATPPSNRTTRRPRRGHRWSRCRHRAASRRRSRPRSPKPRCWPATGAIRRPHHGRL